MYQSVSDLESEDDESVFVEAFRKLMRNLNVLQSNNYFDWKDLPIDAHEFENYKEKYLDIYEKLEREGLIYSRLYIGLLMKQMGLKSVLRRKICCNSRL